MYEQSYTIAEFCAAERMSRSMFYKLKNQGKGPRVYYIGNVQRITHKARLDWHREREAAANHQTIADFNRGGAR